MSEEEEILKRQIRQLEKELEYHKLRAEFYDTMIDIAEEQFKIPLRKEQLKVNSEFKKNI